MARLYQRVAVLTVDNLQVQDLHVHFKVVKTHKKEPNTADIVVHNLNESSRAGMAKKGAAVVLSAGYTGTAAQIFSGVARTIDHVKKGPDMETHIQCGDGETQYVFGRVSESYAPGTRVVDVLRRLATAMGVKPGNLEAQANAGGFRKSLEQYAHGFSACGRASVEFDRVARSLGLEWSIQDGALLLTKQGKVAPGRSVLLTPETGLIGSPDHGTPDKKGKPSVLKVRSLLQPTIVLGGLVVVQAKNTRGAFRVEKLEHSGDTSTGDWYTDIECRPSSETEVLE